MTGRENGRLFLLVAGSETRRIADAEGQEILRGYYAQVNMLLTVCDVKWSSGTLGDSGLVRARAAQKYLARGGL